MNRQHKAEHGSGPLWRRLFLIGLGLGLAGWAIFGGVEAKADGLPPGIANCRDEALKTLYRDQVGGRSRFGSLNNRLNGILGGGYFDEVLVKSWTKKIEPALYLLREQINYRGSNQRGITVRLPEMRDVPQMLHFDRGIENFYLSYVYEWGSIWIPHEKSIGSEQTKRAPESHFVHSIAYASYDDEETAKAKAKEYLDSDMEGKTRVVLDMKRRFQEMGNGDKLSKDPRDPYNRKLVAAWASFMVTNHYNYKREDYPSQNLINYELEIPLRETTGRIRAKEGESKYINDYF